MKSRRSDKPKAQQRGPRTGGEAVQRTATSPMTEEAIRAESPLDSRGGGGDSGRTEDVFRSDPTGEGLERAGQESWRQRIAERAYALYEEAGRPDGSDLEHWLEAEREVGGAPEQWDH